MTLIEHLEELRLRIIVSLGAVAAAAAVTFQYQEPLLTILTRPVGRLVFLSPQEPLVIKIKVACWGGFFLASPVVLFQVWRFLTSGLTAKEKQLLKVFIPLSFLLFVLGLGFGFFIAVPAGVHFLLGFASESLTPMISLAAYVSFVGSLVLAFGLVFQLPLVMLFLTAVDLISPAFLARRRRHAIVAIFIAAAVLTPPDVVSQVLMALPLWVLYEIGVLLSKWTVRRRRFPSYAEAGTSHQEQP